MRKNIDIPEEIIDTTNEPNIIQDMTTARMFGTVHRDRLTELNRGCPSLPASLNTNRINRLNTIR